MLECIEPYIFILLQISCITFINIYLHVYPYPYTSQGLLNYIQYFIGPWSNKWGMVLDDGLLSHIAQNPILNHSLLDVIRHSICSDLFYLPYTSLFTLLHTLHAPGKWYSRWILELVAYLFEKHRDSLQKYFLKGLPLTILDIATAATELANCQAQWYAVTSCCQISKANCTFLFSFLFLVISRW